MKAKKYIPALRYSWLTKFFDPIISITIPEKRMKEFLINQAQIKDNEKILDFGCGTGTLSIMISEIYSDTSIVGLDVDEEILNIAKQKINQIGLSIPLDIYTGNKFPYPDSSFDKVVSSLVFHHLDTSEKLNVLREIFRILKPSGELHIADWGRPENNLMRFLFHIVQIFDGYRTTSDNVKGLLPSFMQHAGFWNANKTGQINTSLGTLAFYSGIKLE